MTKQDFIFMLRVRDELPADAFSEKDRETYKATIDKWFDEYILYPPFKPGTLVQCVRTYYGKPLKGEGLKARIIGSYYDLYGHARLGQGTGEYLCGAEHDLINGYDNTFRQFHKYEIRFEDTGNEDSWWWHHYLRPVNEEDGLPDPAAYIQYLMMKNDALKKENDRLADLLEKICDGIDGALEAHCDAARVELQKRICRERFPNWERKTGT